jgi:endoglucanase
VLALCSRAWARDQNGPSYPLSARGQSGPVGDSRLRAVGPTSEVDHEQGRTSLAGAQAVLAGMTSGAFALNARLGRGINLGDALDAEPDVVAVRLDDEVFDAIRAAGFESVRLPVRWPGHADQRPPFRIDVEFVRRVESAVQQAVSRQLPVIVDVHHYREAMLDPDSEQERFAALWRQIASALDHFPVDMVLFELLNEPHGALTASLWNDWLAMAVSIVRATSGERTILVGPGDQYAIDRLIDLRLPRDDNIIVTIHYYEPFAFTHQGAEWLRGVDTAAWLGTKWGSRDQRAAVRADLARAAAWGAEHGRPLNIGEFGSIRHADEGSRHRWTAHVAALARRHGMSYHYWEFGGVSFGLYDRATSSLRPSLLSAALAEPMPS